MTPVLQVSGMYAGYGAVPVLHDIGIDVAAGEVVGLLGPNGAGKTTLIRAVSGAIPISRGSLRLSGTRLGGPLYRRARAGIGVVSEERSIIRQLTVADHFRLARVDSAECYELFPELERRAEVKAGLLSGGEQQMLALVLALTRRPALLLADELSIGLSPMVVDRLLSVIRASANEGIGVLLVEQQVRRTLQVADRAHVMHRGKIVLSGSSAELRGRTSEIESAYLRSAIDRAGPAESRAVDASSRKGRR